MRLSADNLHQWVNLFGFSLSLSEVHSLLVTHQGYAEGFFQCLGASQIDSLDNSNYEDATLIHDLNQPIPEAFKDRYSVLFDGGSLEHIFNFPIAIQNCMEMLQVGGHYLGMTPANNFMGHGLYQFSPDLYFRVFSPENGFTIEEMFLIERDPQASWYRVKDPKNWRRRINLCNASSTYLLVLAKKQSCCDIFTTPPQQSSCVQDWEQSKVTSTKSKNTSNNSSLKTLLPDSLRSQFKKLRSKRIKGPANYPDAFEPVDMEKLYQQ